MRSCSRRRTSGSAYQLQGRVRAALTPRIYRAEPALPVSLDRVHRVLEHALDRLRQRPVNVESTIEPGDLEEPRDGRVAGGDRELPPLGLHPLGGRDEDVQRRRVHECGLGEIEDDVGRLDRPQQLVELRGGVEIDLSLSRDHLDVRSEGNRLHAKDEAYRFGGIERPEGGSVVSLESGGTAVQVDLGEVEPGGLEPALDTRDALPCATVGSGATVEIDDNLVALASEWLDLRSEVLETLEKRERQRGRGEVYAYRFGQGTPGQRLGRPRTCEPLKRQGLGLQQPRLLATTTGWNLTPSRSSSRTSLRL